MEPGAPLAEVHARSHADATRAEAALREAFSLSADPVPAPPDAYEVIGA